MLGEAPAVTAHGGAVRCNGVAGSGAVSEAGHRPPRVPHLGRDPLRGPAFSPQRAAELADDLAHGEPARAAGLRDALHRRLADALPGRVHLNGPTASRLPDTLNVSIDALLGHDLLAATPEIAASTGSACHSGTYNPSPVLIAMGLDADRALGAVRLSLGRWSTTQETETAADALAKAAAASTPSFRTGSDAAAP